MERDAHSNTLYLQVIIFIISQNVCTFLLPASLGLQSKPATGNIIEELETPVQFSKVNLIRTTSIISKERHFL